METAFVEEPKTWYENDNHFVNHPQQSIGKYTGIYSYYSDVENNCFYLHISYTEDSINGHNDDVYVNFNIVNSSREYQFFVDKNGFFYAENSIKSAFDVAVNFGTPTEQGQEIYIGLEFLNKNDRKCNNVISFSLNVNGQSYDLCRGAELNYQEEETAKSNNTAETSNAGTSAATTQAETKFKYSGGVSSTKAGNDSYKTESNQKFVYNGEAQEDNQAEYYCEEEEQNREAEIIVKQKNKSSFAVSAKIMLAVSGLCIITGVPMAACGLVIKKRIKGNDKENE
ncbi:MAG: hypothetical protein K2G22_00030 [Eubacterium sp.]|nr:hypothetical protein [Eubacterium sp.]